MDYTDLYNFQKTSGTIVPNDAEIISGVQERFKDIFGAELDLSAETPVGRLIEAFSVLVKTTLGVTAQCANQFNPEIATGPFLDSIAAIFNLKRNPPLRTEIKVRCFFSNNTTASDIPAGTSVMSSETGDTFTIQSPIIASTATPIGEGRFYGESIAIADEYGPVPGTVGTVDVLQNSGMGWLGVTNTELIKVGRFEETDEEFRKRIRETRAIGTGSLLQIKSRLGRIDGVYAMAVVENNDSDELYNNGITIPPHSIFICVYTGSSAVSTDLKRQIADAVEATKPVGTGISGEDSEVSSMGATFVGDAISSAGLAVPFWIPAMVNIHVSITVTLMLYTGNDFRSELNSAIKTYVNGVGIGEPVLVTEMASLIQQKVSGISISSISLGVMNDNGGYSTLGNTVITYAFQKAIVETTNIEINEL